MHRPRVVPPSGRGVTLAVAIMAFAGCGNLTAGGFGEARVVVSGDAPDVSSASEPLQGISHLVLGTAVPGPIRTDHDDDDDLNPDGELELSFELYLRRADGSETSLSNGLLEAELDLSGEIEFDVVRATVPADLYPQLRIVFREIEVDVNDGVVIDGVPVIGAIDVEIEDVEVVRTLDLVVTDGSVVEVVLDLNAATWLAFVDPELKTVSAEDFANAFAVLVR